MAKSILYPRRRRASVISKWIGTRVLETTGKRGDAILGRGTYEVAADGQTLTATVAGIDGQGKPFEQIIVFDRASAES